MRMSGGRECSVACRSLLWQTKVTLLNASRRWPAATAKKDPPLSLSAITTVSVPKFQYCFSRVIAAAITPNSVSACFMLKPAPLSRTKMIAGLPAAGCCRLRSQPWPGPGNTSEHSPISFEKPGPSRLGRTPAWAASQCATPPRGLRNLAPESKSHRRRWHSIQ
jgi:hypothetical protein